jgi:hypothetical protein
MSSIMAMDHSHFGTPLCAFAHHNGHTMVDLGLEDVLANLNLTAQTSFYPRKGFEHLSGSEDHWFYVVTRGFVPGIYTHW